MTADASVATAVVESPRRSVRAVVVVGGVMGALLMVGVPSVLSVSAPWTDAPASLEHASPAAARRRPAAAPAVSDDSAGLHASRDLRQTGDAAYARGEMVEAVRSYQDAAAASPGDAPSRNNLAQALVRQGRAAEALSELDAAVNLDGNQWSYRFNRARVYGLLDRWPEAIAEYRVALRLFPDDYATHYNLGLAHMKLQQFAEAVPVLERATTLAPEQHELLITLGTACIGAGEQAPARAAFERFLTAAPTAPDAPRVRALLASMDAVDK